LLFPFVTFSKHLVNICFIQLNMFRFMVARCRWYSNIIRTENNGPILLKVLAKWTLDVRGHEYCIWPSAVSLSRRAARFPARVSQPRSPFRWGIENSFNKFRNYKSVRMFRESEITTPPTIVACVRGRQSRYRSGATREREREREGGYCFSGWRWVQIVNFILLKIK